MMQQIPIGSMTYEVLVNFLENEYGLDMATWRFRSDTFKRYYQVMDRIIEGGIKALCEEKAMDALLDKMEA